MSIEETVIEIIGECTDPLGPQITRETRLIDHLFADSLDMAEMAFELSREFGISLGDADIDRLATVGAIVDHVAALVDEKNASA